MLQPFPEFKQDMRTGLQIHLAHNLVTDFAGVELSIRWMRQYEARPRRLELWEFMAKKKDMLHGFMKYKAGL